MMRHSPLTWLAAVVADVAFGLGKLLEDASASLNDEDDD